MSFDVSFTSILESIHGLFVLRALLALYLVVCPLTFIYLTFFDGYEYTVWNWLVAIPLNVYLSSLWPVYWSVFWWIF